MCGCGLKFEKRVCICMCVCVCVFVCVFVCVCVCRKFERLVSESVCLFCM